MPRLAGRAIEGEVVSCVAGRLELHAQEANQPSQASARPRDAVRADALFGTSDPVFAHDDRDLHWAIARYLCWWMDEEKPTGEGPYAGIFGETLAPANEEWLSWVRTKRFRPAAGSIGGRCRSIPRRCGSLLWRREVTSHG
jgi:hypothetical protein